MVGGAAVLVIAMAGLLTPRIAARAPARPSVVMTNAAQSALAATTAIARTTSPGQPDAPAAAAHQPGDLEHALEAYRAALVERPADAELLANTGQILVAMSRPAEAVPFLKQAVEAEPFSVVARFDLAVAYARSGELTEAVRQYEALVQSGSADVRVHHNLGLALRQLGRNAEAAAAFERATALAPNQAPGWLGLALSLEAEGRGGEAAAALERYLALEPAGQGADNVRARIARLRAAGQPTPAAAETGAASSRRWP
jgi:Tfp pilus assembly protein PilF